MGGSACAPMPTVQKPLGAYRRRLSARPRWSAPPCARFQIIGEEITEGRLRLSAEIEREAAGAAGHPVPAAAEHRLRVGGRRRRRRLRRPTNRGQTLGAALEGELRARVPDHLQGGRRRPDRGRLPARAALERPGGEQAPCCGCGCGGGGGERHDPRVPPACRPPRRWHAGRTPSRLAALLRQWVPTTAGLALAGEAAGQLDEVLRCPPALVRIPRLEPDGGFSLPTRFPLELG